MDRTTLSQRITSILRDIKQVSNTLNAMNMMDVQQYPENYEALSTDASLRCEQITCRMRHLVYATTNQSKPSYLEMASEAQGIKIQVDDGILTFLLPSVINKRSKWKSAEFYLDPFVAALSRYADEHTFPKFKSCVVCFAHIYDRKTAKWAVRDADNMELKRYLDAVAAYCMTDDNGLLCDSYITAELGDRNYTSITIMEKRRFPGWINERLSDSEFHLW